MKVSKETLQILKDELLKMFDEGMRVDCSEKNKKLLLGLGIPVYNSEADFDIAVDGFHSLEKSGRKIVRSNLYPTDTLEFVIQGINDKINEVVVETQESGLECEISNTIKLIEDTSSEQVMDVLLYHLEQLLNQKRVNLNIALVFTGE